MRPHTIDDVRGDLEWLYWNEIEGLTHAQIAARVGLDRSQVSRRLARARRYRQEQERVERQAEEQANDDDPKGPFDYDYMELDANPIGMWRSGKPRTWCKPEGSSSVDHGTYHVGGQVRTLTRGVRTTDEAGPTKYDPPDDLKGGVDH